MLDYSLVANTTYTLAVWSGWRRIDTAYGGGYVELWIEGGESPLASVALLDGDQGVWLKNILEYTTGDVAAEGRLEIRLVSNGPLTAFDHLTLTATPVPEPATMSLLAFGGLAMLRWRGR